MNKYNNIALNRIIESLGIEDKNDLINLNISLDDKNFESYISFSYENFSINDYNFKVVYKGFYLEVFEYTNKYFEDIDPLLILEIEL